MCEDWFALKQSLKTWMEKDIGEECEANNFPSKTRLIHEFSNVVMEMAKDIIINPVDENKGEKHNIEWTMLRKEMRKWITKRLGKELLIGKMPYTSKQMDEVCDLTKKMVKKTLIYLKEMGSIRILYSNDNSHSVVVDKVTFENF
ncbi:hypothetical protein LCGC14_2375430 [marine sediment metagenome]|uniref:Uncharacterized protein n=1 Tax=marine sediment metagenome TaxID=412755 RepID=A0A0F9C2L6_9ZZZZ